MSGSIDPSNLLRLIVDHVQPFNELLKKTRKLTSNSRKDLKDCLHEQQLCLLNCLLRSDFRSSTNPFLWVNAYIECNWGASESEAGEVEQGNQLAHTVFSPSACRGSDQPMVDEVHSQIIDYITTKPPFSLSRLLNSKSVGREPPPPLAVFHFEDSRIQGPELPIDLDLPQEAWEKYAGMLRMNENSQWRYVHIASGLRSELLNWAGVYFMVENEAAWNKYRDLVVVPFRLFLSELTSAYLLEQAHRLMERQERLLKEADARKRVFDYIQVPAKELAAEVRRLEVQAGKIQRVLAPLHQNLLRDLERGSIFFDRPPIGDIEIEPNVNPPLKITKAHKFEEVRDKNQFICAVLTAVLDLHGKGLIASAEDLENQAKQHLTNEDRPDFKETSKALWAILAINGELDFSNEDKLKEVFLVLKGTCHSPFKVAGYEFDANICYPFFGGTRDPQKPLSHCPIIPPNQPELFLEGCKAFIRPKHADRIKGLVVDIQPAGQRTDRNHYLSITSGGDEGVYDPFREPDHLIELIKQTVVSEDKPRADDRSKTLLWEWATSPLIRDIAAPHSVGDTVGAITLIFGHLAARITKQEDDGTTIFNARNNEGSLSIELQGSTSMRSITVKCKSNS